MCQVRPRIPCDTLHGQRFLPTLVGLTALPGTHDASTFARLLVLTKGAMFALKCPKPWARHEKSTAEMPGMHTLSTVIWSLLAYAG